MYLFYLDFFTSRYMHILLVIEITLVVTLVVIVWVHLLFLTIDLFVVDFVLNRGI